MRSRNYRDRVKHMYRASWYQSVEERYRLTFGKRSKKIKMLTKDR